MLREFLLAQGVSPKDIAQAVREARRVTQAAQHWAGMAEKLLESIPLDKLGNKTRFAAVLAKKAANVVRVGADGMLGPVKDSK